MHIGVDASAWDNERGFGRFTRCLLEALARRDTGFTYTLLFDQPPERPVPDGLAVKVAGASQSMADAASGKGARGGGDLFSLAMAARRLDCDVFFYPAVYSYYPLLARRPSVVCFHDTIPERFPDLIFPSKRNKWFWDAKCWLAKKLSTRVMTISEASATDLTDILNIPRTKIDVITEGADPVFQPTTDPEALQAARRAYGIGDEARFWDNVDELKDGASRDARSSDRILFTGEIDDGAMARLLSAADALVFPSLWEGFGLPAVEAMASGTPVLASDRGSLPEVVGDGGLYYDPESVDALADATIRLLTDDGLRADLRSKALAQAATFSWDKGAALAEKSFLAAVGRDQASS